MAKKDNLPKAMDAASGAAENVIEYSPEVLATIVGVATNEIQGIAEMANAPGGIMGKNRNITRGVRLEVTPDTFSCDIYVVLDYDRPIHQVAGEVQENVRKAIESMTGLTVRKVDVHVTAISFEKHNDALLEAQEEQARIESGISSRSEFVVELSDDSQEDAKADS